MNDSPSETLETNNGPRPGDMVVLPMPGRNHPDILLIDAVEEDSVSAKRWWSREGDQWKHVQGGETTKLPRGRMAAYDKLGAKWIYT